MVHLMLRSLWKCAKALSFNETLALSREQFASLNLIEELSKAKIAWLASLNLDELQNAFNIQISLEINLFPQKTKPL